jgi:hypothetical protein
MLRASNLVEGKCSVLYELSDMMTWSQWYMENIYTVDVTTYVTNLL